MKEPQVVPGKYEVHQERPVYYGAELVGFSVVFAGRDKQYGKNTAKTVFTVEIA
ncbi:hypothetical protein TIFTF001_034752 [Ficus carica]|uniref:Uncharacterized protein n=1 Tax=Ficus carica TaxID=3494 RepID=A0AA88E0D1_FICCA|nr:hypothetical protein TIFTF001_034752 [Ficus carica]